MSITLNLKNGVVGQNISEDKKYSYISYGENDLLSELRLGINSSNQTYTNIISEKIYHNGDDISLDTRATNYIISTRKNVFLELNNERITIKSGTRLYFPNGFNDNDYPKFDEIILDHDVILPDDAWTNNSSDNGLLYFDKNLNAYLIAMDRTYSGDTEPDHSSFIGPTNLWWDKTNNIIKKTVDTGSTWESNISVPLAELNWKYENNVTKIDGIVTVFDYVGFLGSSAFALPGMKVAFADGRNEDNTLKNRIIYVDNASVTKYGIDANNGGNMLGFIEITSNLSTPTITTDNIEIYYDYYERPNLSIYKWYDRINNVMYWRNDTEANTHQQIWNVPIGRFAITNGRYTNVELAEPLNIVNFSNTTQFTHYCIGCQYPKSTNNWTWYRIYSDGWVEQGGYINTSNLTTINLPITMSNTNYIIIATSTDAVENKTTISPKVSTASGSITVSSFRISQTYDSNTYYNGRIYWEVKGMRKI